MGQPLIFRLIDKAVYEYNLIENGDKILIGASGGKDSTVTAALCVEALGGEPGIYSARYAPSPQERIDKLLTNLADKDNRKAKFVCVWHSWASYTIGYCINIYRF